MRKAFGGTVNDVVLAVVAGGLRAWLMTRGEPVGSRSVLRAMVPVSVRRPDGDGTDVGRGGNQIASYLIDLPIGEASAVMRLQQVSYAMQAHKDSGQAVGALMLAGVAGFTPPTIHAGAARVARRLVTARLQPRRHQRARAAAAVVRRRSPAAVRLPGRAAGRGQALTIGLTSYDGCVFYGLWADRDAMPDIDVLGQCLEDALAQLVEEARVVVDLGARGGRPSRDRRRTS